MIHFACSACQKKLSVKDELAGKKGKCPGCGQGILIPASLTAASRAEMQTMPPLPGPRPSSQDRGKQPSRNDPSGMDTYSWANKLSATQGGGQPNAGPNGSLTEFLAPSQADDELGRLGKYRILKILGHGGMGVVFKAEDPLLKRNVAIKAMLPALAACARDGQRFLREAQAMAAVEHDHIARIYQVDVERGVPFLAMEFLKGEPLDERLKREKNPPLADVLRIGREMAEGLAAAHATGLIHRDIKPANIWLESPRARVKILDFGLARAVSEDSGLTQEGAIMGTPAYMAPEQGRAEAVDGRCDLFSLGVVLYQMCSGEQPFKGKDIVSTLMEVALHEPPPPRQINAKVPQELSDLVMRLLAKDPAGRPGSASEVVGILQGLERKQGQVVSEEIIAAAPKPARRPQAKAWRSRMLLLIAGALLALVPLGWWIATVILRVETDNGTLVVKIDDAETEARIKNGKLILTGPDDKVRYTLTPGDRNKKLAAGPYKMRVEGADGLVLDTPEFMLKKGGQVTVRVTMEPIAVAKQSLDPDRKAAGYVLSIGGMVKVNGQEREIQAVADLPQEPFQLTFVGLYENKQVSDTGLASFKDCKNVDALDLNGTKVSDAGLAHFTACKNLSLLALWGTQVSDAGLAYFKNPETLTHLDLGGTKVSDLGLAHFKNCKNLTGLWLRSTKVSDLGLAHFTACKNLTELNLTGTNVSDAGLAYFKGSKTLTHLDLGGTKVSDPGLAHFKDSKNLREFRLWGSQVSDAGLAHFKDSKNLRYLDLSRTQVSDTGLAHFKDSKNLRQLLLQKTQVTREKVEELKKALPRCKIEWDGGVIEPTTILDPDSKGAEYVLSIGGTVKVNEQDREINSAADLPSEAFRLTVVNLHGNKQVSDAGLAHFEGCKNLTDLDLSRTRVSNAGLVPFKDCKNLVRL